MPTMIGKVTPARYEELVTEGRRLVAEQTRIQFRLGDDALEIEPLQPWGGAHPAAQEGLLGVEEAIAMYAEDVGVSATAMARYRWVASRWPRQRRQEGVGFTVHQVLASLQDRFEVIKRPPLHERSGTYRWTYDGAQRAVGGRVKSPQTVQEKVSAIHDLARDDAVAAQAAADFLRRPEVAARAMADDTARHLVNQAQAERSRQAETEFRRRTPLRPALERIDHTEEFLDLVAACQRFVASCTRAVPRLRGRTLEQAERATVAANLARVRAAADWVETAVATGMVDMDAELARMLRGE